MIEPERLDWDDGLLDATRQDGHPRATVYRPERLAVVLGRGSRPDIEVHTESVISDGVPMLARRGGGCAVVLDPGNIIVSAVLPVPGFGGVLETFAKLSDWIIDALSLAGAQGVRQAGISDLALGDRKVGGACIYRTRGILYYSASLLFEPDLDLVERYLRHPPREPDYRAGRTHRDFMGSLADSVPDADILTFSRQIGRTLTATPGGVAELDVSGAAGINRKNNLTGAKI